ncbi:MAG: inositol monophosphatase family protein [Parvibaculales bacterium]
MASSPAMNVMMGAAQKAGRALRRDFGEIENLQVSKKGPNDFVTNADLKAEKIIHEELEYARPHYGFLMEESGAIEGRDKSHRWLVDPLDGTTNFMHGIPHFCVSIALERDGVLVAGVIYNPISDELFHAERGQGAYYGQGQGRLRVAARTKLADALIASRVSSDALNKPIINQVGHFRNFGSAALDLAYVAAGRVDAYVEIGLGAWDMAAGGLIVREAGGLVSDISGNADFLKGNTIIAASETIHNALIIALKAD